MTREQEKVLKHLLNLKQNINGAISIGNQMDTYPSKMSDDKLIPILNELESNGLINIKWFSPHHDNLTYAIDITILPDGRNYFKNKKEKKKTNKRESIKTYIPIIISLAALLKSFSPEITLLLKPIMELMK